MKSRVLSAVAVLSVVAACSQSPDAPTSPASPSAGPSLSQNPNDEIQNDPKVHVHLARGQARPGGGGGSPQLVWHNGAILTSTPVKAIFWGTSWTSAGFTGDKISGLNSFYGGIGGTSYMKTNVEYTGTNGTVGAGVSYLGSTVDASPAPRGAPKTADVLGEVCKVVGSSPVANAYYPVYVDTPRGHAGYCAWHSYGSCNGTPVEIGFFFSLDGDGGCDPGDTSSGHSQGLAALANVSGHELSETVTDPANGGWWDASGAENADKCAWTFNGYRSFGGSSWKIQGNWSNKAYLTRSGYDGAGCISG